MMRQMLAKFAFNSAARARTWKKMAAQVENGIALDICLHTLHRQSLSRKSPVAHIHENMLRYLGGGQQLGVGLVGYATAEEVMLISAGQKAGKLADGLRLAADLLLARKKISSAVTGALAYPLFLVTLCIFMLLIVSTQVMPQISMLSDPTLWTGAAAVMYAVCSFVDSLAGAVTMVALLAGIAVMFFSMPRWTGTVRCRADAIPPWSMYRLTVGCVWLLTLATLMRSGMQLTQVLENMQAGEISPYLRERVRAIQRHVGAGNNIGDAMYNAGLGFPDVTLVDDLRIYAKLPGFQHRLHAIAQEWMMEGVDIIQQKARVLNLAFIMLIIAQVAGLALATVSLQSQIIPGGL